MGLVGHEVSSNLINNNINFRTQENNEIISKYLREFQKVNITFVKIKQKIILEDGAPFLQLSTNLCERPIKLLIDTGASLSLIASDLIPRDMPRNEREINLYGVVGKDASIKTKGIVYTILMFDNQFLYMASHLIDRKYAPKYDGFLGFDFFSMYKTKIDMQKMYLQIELKEIFNKKNLSNENVTEEENFLEILANSYEFETTNTNRKHKIDYKNNRVYDETPLNSNGQSENADLSISGRSGKIYELIKKDGNNEDER